MDYNKTIGENIETILFYHPTLVFTGVENGYIFFKDTE